jgi:hypothetical protein
VLVINERLWALFPRDIRLRLRDVALTGLVLSVKNEFLLHERHRDLLGASLFGDPANHYATVDLLQAVFTQEEARDDLLALAGG